MANVNKVHRHAESVGHIPHFALVFYSNGAGQLANLATKHRINANNQLGLGRVVSNQQITVALSEAANSGLNKVPQVLPSTLLVDTPATLVWYAKRKLQRMWFRVGSKPISFLVEWPPLLFQLSKDSRSLRVFALGSDQRPSERTRLYHAPLMNISDNGLLCQGTAKLPGELSVASIAECESTVYDSQFTHTNHDHTLKGGASDTQHVRYWRSKASSKKKGVERVNACELSFTGKRLGDLLLEIG